MWAKSSTGRTQPVRSRDLEHVVERAEVAHAAHHLDAERHRPPLALEPLAQRAELLDDRGDGVLAAAAEQEAGVEDDDLGAARGRDAGAPVEAADGGGELAPARLQVAHERRTAAHAPRARHRPRAPPRRAAPPTGSPSRSCPRSRSRRRRSRARATGRPPAAGPRGRGSRAGRHGCAPCEGLYGIAATGSQYRCLQGL